MWPGVRGQRQTHRHGAAARVAFFFFLARPPPIFHNVISDVFSLSTNLESSPALHHSNQQSSSIPNYRQPGRKFDASSFRSICSSSPFILLQISPLFVLFCWSTPSFGVLPPLVLRRQVFASLRPVCCLVFAPATTTLQLHVCFVLFDLCYHVIPRFLPIIQCAFASVVLAVTRRSEESRKPPQELSLAFTGSRFGSNDIHP